VCYRERERKAEELQKEEDEALQQKAKLEDMFMERRRLEERRKNMELGYGEAVVIFVVIVLLQLDSASSGCCFVFIVLLLLDTVQNKKIQLM
jgi:hypothetical protein